MGNDFRGKFETMVEELRQNSNVKVINVSIAPPASERDIEVALRQANGELPAGVEELYRSMNGFILEWEHVVEPIKEHTDADKGFINILPLLEVWKDWKGITWFDDIEGSEEYKPVKPVDYFVPEACAAFFQLENSAPASTIYYHYFGESLEDTGYSFLEYIDLLLASRGYFYWIETLCNSCQDAAEVTAFRQNMPLIFNDHRSELFVPKDK